MNNMKQTFALTSLATALITVYGPAIAADDVDTNQLSKPSSSVSVGVGGLMGDDRRQLGIVGGLHDTGGYLLFDADINQRNDETGTWQTLSIVNGGMNSREIRAEYQQQGNQGVSVEYRQSEREVPYLINTGVTGLGTGTQAVPTRCTAPGVPAGCYAVGTGTDFQLGTERTKYGLGLFKYVMPNLKLKFNFTNEDKEGNRHGRVGGQPEFAAVPIDWNVSQLDATFDYVLDKLQLSGGYSGSWFRNNIDLLAATRGGTTYYISQPLDNEAHQLFLDGGYNFTPTTRGTFKLSYTHATQDEHIPTYDIAAIAPSPTAPSSLDGEINTTLVQLGVTSRPMPKLNLVANLRYHKVDDATPVWFVVDTATDAHSTPLDYETLTGKVEGTYNLSHGYNLTAGIDYTSQDRTIPVGTIAAGQDTERYVPFRSQLDETTYRIQLRRTMSETVNGAVALLHSRRDGSTYHEAQHSEPGEGIADASIDPINIANRERTKVRLTMDWLPSDALNLQFNVEDAQDNYSGHTYGLRDGTAWLFSVDASYSFSKDWQLTGWYSHDNTEAKQHNYRYASGTYAAADMFDTLEDIGDSVGLGLKGLLNPKLKIGGDLQWTRIENNYQQDLVTSGAGTLYEDPAGTSYTGPLPNITSTTIRIKLFAEYALKKNADLRFDVVHERWKSNDWSWQFIDGSPFVFNDGTKVITYPTQNTTFVSARYNYKF